MTTENGIRILLIIDRTPDVAIWRSMFFAETAFNKWMRNVMFFVSRRIMVTQGHCHFVAQFIFCSLHYFVFYL